MLDKINFALGMGPATFSPQARKEKRNELCSVRLISLSYFYITWLCCRIYSIERQFLGPVLRLMLKKKNGIVDSYYQLAAINKALDACKKQSQFPANCKVAKARCEAFVNGISTRPMWQCTALDQMAKVWPSKIYVHRDDAAIAAKAYCQQGSSFPDTCYINLMTCKNLNPNNK